MVKEIKKNFQIIKRDRKIHNASAFFREYMSNFMLFMMQQVYYFNANEPKYYTILIMDEKKLNHVNHQFKKDKNTQLNY